MHALECNYPESKDGSARRQILSLFMRQWGGHQAKTVKTHSNIVVVLTHIQLKFFYRLSTRDVTHMKTILQATGSWVMVWE